MHHRFTWTLSLQVTLLTRHHFLKKLHFTCHLLLKRVYKHNHRLKNYQSAWETPVQTHKQMLVHLIHKHLPMGARAYYRENPVVASFHLCIVIK